MKRAAPVSPLVPDSIPIRRALDSSESLQMLRQRLSESRGRFEDIAPCLPPPMRALVRPGPLDDQMWTLLAPNTGVAVKLRHLEPRLNQTLREAGWPHRDIKIRIVTS